MTCSKVVQILKTVSPGTEVDLRGWVRTKRESKQDFAFLEVNDGSCMANVQVVVDASVPDYATSIKQIHTGASVAVIGEVKESPGKGQRVEIHARSLRVLGTADPQTYPLQKKGHSFEFLREKAHLRPRTNTFGAIARVRNALCIDPSLLSGTRIPLRADADHHDQRLRRSRPGLSSDHARPREIADLQRSGQLRTRFLRQEGGTDRQRATRRRDFRHRSRRRLYIWPHFSR